MLYMVTPTYLQGKCALTCFPAGLTSAFCQFIQPIHILPDENPLLPSGINCCRSRPVSQGAIAMGAAEAITITVHVVGIAGETRPGMTGRPH